MNSCKLYNQQWLDKIKQFGDTNHQLLIELIEEYEQRLENCGRGYEQLEENYHRILEHNHLLDSVIETYENNYQ